MAFPRFLITATYSRTVKRLQLQADFTWSMEQISTQSVMSVLALEAAGYVNMEKLAFVMPNTVITLSSNFLKITSRAFDLYGLDEYLCARRK